MIRQEIAKYMAAVKEIVAAPKASAVVSRESRAVIATVTARFLFRTR